MLCRACLLPTPAHLLSAPRRKLVSWGSRDLRKTSSAMAWYSDYNARKERLLREGLLVLVRGAFIDPRTGFLGLYFEANESDLLRSNVDREFDVHLTIGFASDYADGVAAEAADRLNTRWRGRLVRLRVAWVGCGGSAQLADDDPIASDEDVRWLHRRGWYGNGQRVRARDLHVSL